MNLYEIIQDEMLTDDEGTDKISSRLKYAYKDADESGKRLIDDIFINLTGWTMNILLEKAGRQ